MNESQQLLEDEAIHWRRDWDCVALGMVLGALTVLAIQGLW